MGTFSLWYCDFKKILFQCLALIVHYVLVFYMWTSDVGTCIFSMDMRLYTCMCLCNCHCCCCFSVCVCVCVCVCVSVCACVWICKCACVQQSSSPVQQLETTVTMLGYTYILLSPPPLIFFFTWRRRKSTSITLNDLQQAMNTTSIHTHPPVASGVSSVYIGTHSIPYMQIHLYTCQITAV